MVIDDQITAEIAYQYCFSLKTRYVKRATDVVDLQKNGTLMPVRKHMVSLDKSHELLNVEDSPQVTQKQTRIWKV